MINGEHVGEPDDKIGVIPCSKRVEPGLFFYPGDGSNLFKAGKSINPNFFYQTNNFSYSELIIMICILFSG